MPKIKTSRAAAKRFKAQVHTNTPRSMLYIKANGLKDYSMAMVITKI